MAESMKWKKYEGGYLEDLVSERFLFYFYCRLNTQLKAQPGGGRITYQKNLLKTLSFPVPVILISWSCILP